MIENTKEYVDFLVKQKLSCNQYLLLHLLYTERMYKIEGKVSYIQASSLYKWLHQGKFVITIEEIESLIKMEYVFGIKNNGEYEIDQLILTEKFFNLMFVNIDAFEEICELYPDKFLIGGQTVFTKAGDLDKVAANYLKLIKNNLSKHEEMKKLIVYAKERGLCNYKIENFLSKGVIDAIKKEIGDVLTKDINDGQQEL